MSTYLPDNDSSNQRDPAQMLYLREPPHNSYTASESPVLAGNMMMYMNFSSSGTLPVSNSDASNQEFVVGIEPRIGESEFGAREMMLMNPMGVQAQGLSLSLSPNIPFQSVQYRNPSHNLGFSSFLSSNASVSGDDNSSQSKSFLGDASPYAIPNVSRTISDSKYLKAAQELLDEVVNVREALKQHISKNESMKDGKGGGVDGDSPSAQESVVNSAQELSAAEKQDLQSKMSKLLSMLDEVDKRYKQYYHQMQIVVSSFDVIAGCGSAKPYTALALQTISRHFRCLRDAINGQIKVTQKSLGEPDGSANGKGVGISRLRYVDQQLRQQKALQQLGMMQQHTWRPQRGLPESSVSILRAWLFEHFLHPYPKDSDKIMLARQTGLTRSQVSNWFINARVRLWKPMVEEMYKEEAGDAEMDQSNSSSEIAPRSRKGDKKSNGDRDEDIQQSAASTATNHQCSSPRFLESKPNQAHDIEMAGTTSADSDFQNVAQLDERFMAAYQMTDFQNVSLTLGLQHCEDGGLPVPHHGFVNMRGDDMYNAGTSSVGTENVDFDCTEPGNRQQRFGSSHLLHDFVA